MESGPTLEQLAEDATRVEHLMGAAKVLFNIIDDPLNRPRHRDMRALNAILESVDVLVASVAIELRTASDRAEMAEHQIHTKAKAAK